METSFLTFLKLGSWNWYCGLQVPLRNAESWKTWTHLKRLLEVSLTITASSWLSSKPLNFKNIRNKDSISSWMSGEYFFFIWNPKLWPKLLFRLKDINCIFLSLFLSLSKLYFQIMTFFDKIVKWRTKENQNGGKKRTKILNSKKEDK